MVKLIGNLFKCFCNGEELDNIKNDIREIKNNHLNHIEKEIESIKNDVKLINISLIDLKMDMKILLKK